MDRTVTFQSRMIIWSRGLTPRQIDWPTISPNVTLTLTTLWEFSCLLDCSSWVVCLTVGGYHIPPSPGGGCSDVEAIWEMHLATGACSSCGGLWLCGRWCYGHSCVDWRVEVVVSKVGPIADVGRLHPVVWHRDVAHGSCIVFSLHDNLVGAAVRRLQSSACCVLMVEDVGALPEVAMHECSQGGVACCWNCSEAGHVLEELSDEMRWVHWVGSRSY
jgi:hypothetical protein